MLLICIIWRDREIIHILGLSCPTLMATRFVYCKIICDKSTMNIQQLNVCVDVKQEADEAGGDECSTLS